MTALTVRAATPADHARLVPLMRDFHAHEGIRSPAGKAEAALLRLLAEPQRGQVLVALEDGVPVAYGVVCFGFSVEFNGVDAFLDELYVVPPRRGSGVGQRIIAAAEELCRKAGVVALHLEVDDANARGQALYERSGFRLHGRRLMTKRLS